MFRILSPQEVQVIEEIHRYNHVKC